MTISQKLEEKKHKELKNPFQNIAYLLEWLIFFLSHVMKK